mmetsp:Transcript_36740/g.76505  ORF Transcript_36740/g.76505 Transcript_36740/m.76505 type:complete len:134 (-) Transcript_36740:36-437(-)
MSSPNTMETRRRNGPAEIKEDTASSDAPSGFILKLYQMVNGAPDEVISVMLLPHPGFVEDSVKFDVRLKCHRLFWIHPQPAYQTSLSKSFQLTLCLVSFFVFFLSVDTDGRCFCDWLGFEAIGIGNLAPILSS